MHVNALMTAPRSRAAANKLNVTCSSAHLWSADVARYGQWIIYVAGSGLFAYDMTMQAIAPILLSPLSDSSTNYRYHSVLDDGAPLVVGLDQTGMGPTYKIDLHVRLSPWTAFRTSRQKVVTLIRS